MHHVPPRYTVEDAVIVVLFHLVTIKLPPKDCRRGVCELIGGQRTRTWAMHVQKPQPGGPPVHDICVLPQNF